MIYVLQNGAILFLHKKQSLKDKDSRKGTSWMIQMKSDLTFISNVKRSMKRRKYYPKNGT